MKALWKRYAERIDGLTLRERVMVFSSAMVVLLALVYSAFLDPQMQRERRVTGAIAQKQAEARTLQDQLTRVATSRGLDPDRALRDRLREVRGKSAEIDGRIAAEERKFTAPAQMRRVIEELLARNRTVELKSMKSLATTSIAETKAPAAGVPAPAKAAAAAAERLIYRHGVEVVVSGAYLDLLAYVADLERLPTQLYWSALNIDAGEYPKHTMRLTLYTLSLDKSWLNV